jgi:hypothetical protein
LTPASNTDEQHARHRRRAVEMAKSLGRENSALACRSSKNEVQSHRLRVNLARSWTSVQQDRLQTKKLNQTVPLGCDQIAVLASPVLFHALVECCSRLTRAKVRNGTGKLEVIHSILPS